MSLVPPAGCPSSRLHDDAERSTEPEGWATKREGTGDRLHARTSDLTKALPVERCREIETSLTCAGPARRAGSGTTGWRNPALNFAVRAATFAAGAGEDTMSWCPPAGEPALGWDSSLDAAGLIPVGTPASCRA